MKSIILCRHAKSSWKDLSLADRDRPLNKRGKRDAPEMGRRLAGRNLAPDAVLTSPAKRARATAKKVAKELGFPGTGIQVHPSLYDASPMLLLHLVRSLDPSVNRVMLFGHNPEFTLFANLLGNLHIVNVPTCGMVALEFGIEEWEELDEGTGQLLFFDYPKSNCL